MKMKFTAVFFLFSIFNMTSQNQEIDKLMAQDWANLKKYQRANKALLDSSEKITAVFMGNSITESWVNINPGFFSENNFIGRGIGGQTSPQMLIRFMTDVVELNPEVVVILAGTNDIAGNTGFTSEEMITNNIKAMAQLATANGIEVVLSSILPVYDYAWRPGLEPVQKIASINSWLKHFAEENGHIYLDYYAAMIDEKKGLSKEYSEDGVHPNLKGYQVMEQLAIAAVEQARSSQ